MYNHFILAGIGGNPTMAIILVVVLVIVVGFVIFSSITGKKARKKEASQRKKVVRDEIKTYLFKVENTKNVSVEFEKVAARKGPEYKYRDVFDVIVNISAPKTAQIIDTRSYEIEGKTTKIDKKNYKTDWVVVGVTDLEETRRRVSISEKKVKLTKEEKSLFKKQEKEKLIEMKKQQKEELVTAKANRKNPSPADPEKEKLLKKSTVKFVPRR